MGPNTIFSYFKFEGQKVMPPWQAQLFNTEINTWHEFGHAWGVINGRRMSRTDPEALDWENQMRERFYGPLGPKNARRGVH